MCELRSKIGAIASLAQSIKAEAVEIKVIAGAAFVPALAELGPQFECSTGHELTVEYGIASTIRGLIEHDHAVDLVIASAGVLGEATEQGRIATGARTEIARVGMAVAVRVGTPKPDISSVSAFKRTLLNARSVTYPPAGAVGLHLAKVFAKLGITEQMKPKIKPQQIVERVPQAVAAGEAELGFAPSTVLLAAAGIELVGPFPAHVQDYIVYMAGIGAAAKQPEAAQALVRHLTTPSAVALLKVKGFELAPQ